MFLVVHLVYTLKIIMIDINHKFSGPTILDHFFVGFPKRFLLKIYMGISFDYTKQKFQL